MGTATGSVCTVLMPVWLGGTIMAIDAARVATNPIPPSKAKPLDQPEVRSKIVQELTDVSWDKLVAESKKPVVIFYNAGRFRETRQIRAIVNDLGDRYSEHLTVLQLNVDKYDYLGRQLGLLSHPAVLFLCREGVVQRLVGVYEKDVHEGAFAKLARPRFRFEKVPEPLSGGVPDAAHCRVTASGWLCFSLQLRAISMTDSLTSGVSRCELATKFRLRGLSRYKKTSAEHVVLRMRVVGCR
jgi:hypothetical protein